PEFSRAPARMKTEPLHRSVMKDGSSVHSSFPNELRQPLSARVPEEIWRQKNITFSALTRKIDRFAPNHAPKFRRKFFAAQFGQRHRAFVILERFSEIRGFTILQAMIKMAEPVPAKGRDRDALLQLGEEPAGHPLHPGIAGGPARISHIDENIHCAGTCQQMNWARVSCT